VRRKEQGYSAQTGELRSPIDNVTALVFIEGECRH